MSTGEFSVFFLVQDCYLRHAKSSRRIGIHLLIITMILVLIFAKFSSFSKKKKPFHPNTKMSKLQALFQLKVVPTDLYDSVISSAALQIFYTLLLFVNLKEHPVKVQSVYFMIHFLIQQRNYNFMQVLKSQSLNENTHIIFRSVKASPKTTSCGWKACWK